MEWKYLRILIVDDHAASALSLAHFCQTVADHIDLAGTAREAIGKLGAHEYGCIIIDCRLPDRDGLELARWIRETSGQPNRYVPIIGVSADPRWTLERCREAGMTTFLLKPYEPQSVVDLIRSLD